MERRVSTPTIISATSLRGTPVVNPQSESLGEIKEIMLDARTAQIAYVVLSFGGFLGMGDKLFAFPWEVFQMDPNNEQLVLDVAKEKLENAPGFDKDHWPSDADSEWVSRVYSYYDVPPYWD
ncbi:MAG TPA: PRC-barrel domain-containing protein [Acidobacteriota bacterium]|nr:PRC-barrel domain-containing protein [Acidobacteriota bacterium]